MIASSPTDFTAAPNDRAALLRIKDALTDTQAEHHAQLIAPHGTVIELPASLLLPLQELVTYLAQGQRVNVVAMDKDVTAQDAADILNVSRLHVVKLLDDGDLPYTIVGNQRHVNADALLEYKNKRDADRRSLLIEMDETDGEHGF